MNLGTAIGTVLSVYALVIGLVFWSKRICEKRIGTILTSAGHKTLIVIGVILIACFLPLTVFVLLLANNSKYACLVILTLIPTVYFAWNKGILPLLNAYDKANLEKNTEK